MPYFVKSDIWEAILPTPNFQMEKMKKLDEEMK